MKIRSLLLITFLAPKSNLEARLFLIDTYYALQISHFPLDPIRKRCSYESQYPPHRAMILSLNRLSIVEPVF